MLDASALIATTDDTTKNPFIQALLAEVSMYNAMPGGANLQSKADQLLIVCRQAAEYATSKPPQQYPSKPGGGKTYRRWEAVDALLGQISAEVQALGLRMLRTTASFKEIGSTNSKSSYWLELVDPVHGIGNDLSHSYHQWIKDPGAIAARTSFWDYLGRAPNPASHQFMVKYYPEMEYDDEQGLLHFDAGKLHDEDDDVWSTANEQTHFAGKGWGIFVVSPDGKIYGGSHVVGQHHHSSFLGGGMVTAAGEMVVDATGVIRFITAKSGHYTPTVANMQNFVTQFHQIPADTLIQPSLAKAVVLRVGQFRTCAANPLPAGLCREEVELWLRQRCGAATLPNVMELDSNPAWRPMPAPRP